MFLALLRNLNGSERKDSSAQQLIERENQKNAFKVNIVFDVLLYESVIFKNIFSLSIQVSLHFVVTAFSWDYTVVKISEYRVVIGSAILSV